MGDRSGRRHRTSGGAALGGKWGSCRRSGYRPRGLSDVFGDDDWVFATVDVRDAAAVGDAAANLTERTGPPDILVNSAGISASASIRSHDLALWNYILATNLSGSFNLIRTLIGGMCERGFGRIVNVSSGSGFRVAASTRRTGRPKRASWR